MYFIKGRTDDGRIGGRIGKGEREGIGNHHFVDQISPQNKFNLKAIILQLRSTNYILDVENQFKVRFLIKHDINVKNLL